jgi:hypothetical protein
MMSIFIVVGEEEEAKSFDHFPGRSVEHSDHFTAGNNNRSVEILFSFRKDISGSTMHVKGG